MEAQAVWRQFPRQIAADLSRFHRRRIAEWHSGDMSSYELLELCEFMPEEGALARAVRQGERPDWQLMLAQIANETAITRASTVQGVSSDDYGSRLWLPLSTAQEQTERAQEADEAYEELEATFIGKDIGKEVELSPSTSTS